ncbi:MAG: ATP-binding protein [Mobiluncus sp.]|nr:ATP-binding protein [Mobiluncus sp.]MCI6584178.1 ATP-binding protein [Mobiluncus sp.]
MFKPVEQCASRYPEGGTVTVKTTAAPPPTGTDGTDSLSASASSVTPGNRWVSVSVTDTGIGLSSTELSRVFQPFFRGAATHDQPGSGIGLTITKSLVEAHGGRVTAASAGAGQGATFTVLLPSAAPYPRG